MVLRDNENFRPGQSLTQKHATPCEDQFGRLLLIIHLCLFLSMGLKQKCCNRSLSQQSKYNCCVLMRFTICAATQGPEMSRKPVPALFKPEGSCTNICMY